MSLEDTLRKEAGDPQGQQIVRRKIVSPAILSTGLIVSLLMLAVVSGACRRSAPLRPTHEGVTGTVVTVDKDQGTIQINHEEIKGYMPAMTMSFRVKKKFLLDDIKPGDRVSFTLRDTGNGYVISQLKKQ